MKVLDDWHLEEVIGSGGLAEVWRARPVTGGAAVALKVLREPDRSVAHRERFLREGHLLGRLFHPGLTRCLGVCDGPQPYLVLELLEGENLSERLRDAGRLPVDQVFAMADTLLRTLSYLHERGITHRDVKASNVYLSDDGRILLLDLGLATDPHHALITTLGDVMGTYAYMAPEQIAGAQVDHRCDLYSLGVTLYEALAGQRPYREKDKRQYGEAHRRGNAPPLSTLRPEAPVRLVDVIARLMARDPADRPASAGIAQALLVTGEDRHSLRAPPLVGRAAAIGAVQAVLDAGGVVIIHGEIGSGTGRMALVALKMASEEQAVTLAVRCRPGSPPQALLHHLTRELSEISGPVEARVAPLGRALGALAAEGRTVLLIENLEHAPPETLAELGRILRIARGLAVVVTAASAPTGLEGHRVYLRPLRPEETQQLVCGMLGTNSPPVGLPGYLHRLSGGLPGVVVQALRELETRGSLRCEGISDDGALRWVLEPDTSLTPTTTLARLFGGVLSSLDAPDRRLLEVLAVAGEPLPLGIALRLAEAHPSGESLHALIRRGLADRELHDGREWVSLRRPAVGSLLGSHLPDPVRRRLHLEIADALRQLEGSGWRDQLITWHAAHGASPEDAALAMLVLGESLHERGQHARALTVLEKAEHPDLPTALLTRLTLARGEALEAVGRRTEAREALTRARLLAEELRDDALLGRALVGLAQVLDRQGLKQRAAALAEEAMALFDEDDNDPSLLRALLLAASAMRLSTRRDAAARLYNRCIDLAVDHDRRAFAAMAHGGLGEMLAEDGHLEEATLHIEQEAAYARLNQLSNRLAPTLLRLASCFQRLGRLDLALESIDEAEAVARAAELPYEVARAQVGRAEVYIAAGDLGRAGELLAEGRVAQQPTASADLRLAYRATVADYRLSMGDRQAALATFQAAELEASRAGFAVVRAYFLGMIGVLTAHPDKLLEAMDLLEDTGDRRLSARLLYYGGTMGGDAEVLEFAVEEARASGDRFLMLEVLHAMGGALAHAEARRLVELLQERLPPDLRGRFAQRPAVRWALSTEIAAVPHPLPSVPRYEGDFRPDFEILEES